MSDFNSVDALVVVLLASLAATCSVQMIKAFTRMRGNFHASAIQNYLRLRLLANPYPKLSPDDDGDSMVDEAWRELTLALRRMERGGLTFWSEEEVETSLAQERPTRDPLSVQLNLPLERLMAEISSALQAADPTSKTLFWFSGLLGGYLPTRKSISPEVESGLRYRIDRGLDELGAVLGEGWRVRVRSITVMLGVIYSAILAGLVYADGTAEFAGMVLAGAVISGPLSWTMRDIMAGIERWRLR